MRHVLCGIAAALAITALLPGMDSLYAQQSAGTETENESQDERQDGHPASETEADQPATESEAGQAQQSEQDSTESDAEQPTSEPDTQAPTGTPEADTQADNESTVDQESSAGETANFPPPDAPDQAADRSAQEGDDARARRDRRNDGQQPTDRRDSRDPARDGADMPDRADRQNRRDNDRVNVNLGISFGTSVGGRGLAINTIERNSVFFDSGLEQGDVIISVYGRPVRSEVDFVTVIQSRPGTRIPVVVLRDGREETIYVTYEQDVIQIQPDAAVEYPDGQAVGGPGYLGVMFDMQFPNAAVIRSVLPDSPAAHAGLRAGDEIVALNGEAVSSYPAAVQRIGMMRAGEPLAIAFTRRVENQTDAILAPRPASGVRTANRPIDDGSGAVPPPVIEPPRNVEPGPGFRPEPGNRGPLNQPNRPRLLSPLRN